MNRPDDEFTKAVEFLKNDDRFHVVLNFLVERRELMIGGLATYKSPSDLRKAAADIVATTDLLDLFGVPTGTVKSPMEAVEAES